MIGKIFYPFLFLVMIGLLGIIALKKAPEIKVPLGQIGQLENFIVASTTASVQLGAPAVSTLVSGTSTDSSRFFMRITNTATTSPTATNAGAGGVWLMMDRGRAAAMGDGIWLAPLEYYDMDSRNMYMGAIYAMASSSPTNLSVYLLAK